MLSRIAIALTAAAPLIAAAPAVAGPESLTTIRVASGLARPVMVTHAPGDFERLYIVEQYTARIRILNLRTGELNATPFMDINPRVIGSGNERGLLGLAFHPDFQSNGWFVVNYNDNFGDTVVERFTAKNGDTADPGTGQVLLTIDQPYSNHNGGWLGFGPNDGYLYIATGDGGSGGDPGDRAQDITAQLLGKMLRIELTESGYTVPGSNPFVGVTGDDEIWAYGLRNPWRNSFDRETGDLYIGDVGQNAWEEINVQPASSTGGENYGWRCWEGDHSYNPSGCAPSSTMVFPVHEYSHSLGYSLTGGYVYRGCDIPSLDGTYFFADYGSRRIWSFRWSDGTVSELTERTTELAPTGFVINSISSFGEDARGEIYIVDLGGEVFKIVSADTEPNPYDVDCDGVVAINDLLILLAEWGDCDGCVTDFDGNGVVDVTELLALLANWS